MKCCAMKFFEILSVCVLAAVPGAEAAETGDESAFAPPKLTVKGWHFELDGKPVYLAGYSPGVMDEVAQSTRPVKSRLEALPKGINYMRTWLEWRRDEPITPPFVLVDGKADLSRIDPEWLDALEAFLNASARARVVPEITLFNPWAARELWDLHWWNPANNVQGHAVDPASLYTLGNPCQPYQEQWTRAILDVVDRSLARDFIIIEIDNELKTGGGPWREHFVNLVASRGDYLISTIHSYCADYDPVAGKNHIINIHGGGSGNADQYHRVLGNFGRVKPAVFNELYVWWHHPREVQRSVMWSIFMGGGMFCAYHWGLDEAGGKVDLEATGADAAAVGRFASSIPFHRLEPEGAWFVGGPGNARTAAFNDGSGYLAYLWGGDGGPVTVAPPAGQYTVSWFDPRTAEVIKSTPTDITGEVRLDPPQHEHDILCLIQKERTE
jgi:hypothetical protein